MFLFGEWVQSGMKSQSGGLVLFTEDDGSPKRNVVGDLVCAEDFPEVLVENRLQLRTRELADGAVLVLVGLVVVDLDVLLEDDDVLVSHF